MTCHNYAGHHYQMVQYPSTRENAEKFAVRQPADARSDVHARCHPAGRSRGSFWSPQCYLGTSLTAAKEPWQSTPNRQSKNRKIQHGTQEKHIVQVGKFILKIQPFRFRGKFRGCNGGNMFSNHQFLLRYPIHSQKHPAVDLPSGNLT